MSKFFVAALAALFLTACETTAPIDSADGASPGAKRPVLVVRGAVVPNDPEPQTVASARRVRRAKPVVEAGDPARAPASAPVAASAGLASAASAAAATAASGVAAVAETIAPAVTTTNLPAVETATPTPTDAQPAQPSATSTDYPAMIQAMIGGMPLWLLGLVGVVLLAAIAMGLSGGRKPAA